MLSVVTVALLAGSSQIEADWLHHDAVRHTAAQGNGGGAISCEEDAAGGCDGVKDATWGFHTAHEEKPWWQVDLRTTTALDHVVIYNRCDACSARNGRILVLLSDDGCAWKRVYQHDGTVFYGYTDRKPLVVPLGGREARYLRLQHPGTSYFHLDEVEIYPAGDARNVALGKPATQSSTSQWSKRSRVRATPAREYHVAVVIQRGRKLAERLTALGADSAAHARALEDVAKRLEALPLEASVERQRMLYLEARWAVRRMALANPLLDFDRILFVKRAPGMLPHMSDQFYGWWSRPGGGIYVLEGFKGPSARVRCLTSDWPAGSFLRPDLSYDGKRVLFAYCKHYPHVSRMEKVDKTKLPEDAFYHIFEMDIDGTGVRQLTHGRYDDFDSRYLPSGEIVFLSTRKGQFIQIGKAGTQATCSMTLPDSYVRCGGDNRRPCAVFTLHAMHGDGSELRPVSAFENFEWTPSVARDGRILYARWDYIDRFNGPFMSLWSTNPDGTNAQLVYGNFTTRPQCVFEARPVPGSHKLVFTASAHHSITGGSLCLLDTHAGNEGDRPLTRLTPEVCFPETEGWRDTYYANPFPLSEEFYLVGWSDRRLPPHHGSGTVRDDRNPVNAMGIYLYDAFGNLELLHRDPQISSMYPIPIKPRQRPPVSPDTVDWKGAPEGRFLIQDIYLGLEGIERGAVKRLRIVGVPPKPQPQMNQPNLGVSKEDPGKFVLGTVPVKPDGSAYFRAPAGVSVFFQALDARGMVVQTMRTLTYVQPGQTLSCIGCHESREQTPAVRGSLMATAREASRILPGPSGTWPLRFDRLVQPVLQAQCVRCHNSTSEDQEAARFDLSAAHAYENLLAFGGDDLRKLAFERDFSPVGECPAQRSKLLAFLTDGDGHAGVRLDPEDFNRLVTWMDTYAHRQGSFSERQERQLEALRREWANLLVPGDEPAEQGGE